MSLHSVIHDGLKALIEADTGAGGLVNTSSAAYLRGNYVSGDPITKDTTLTFRLLDPEMGEERTLNYPWVQTEAFTGAEHGFGVVQGCEVNARIHVYDLRDNRYTTIDAVTDRLRTVFHNVAIASGESWTFTPAARLRAVAAPSAGNVLHWVVEFSFQADRTVA